MRIRFQVIEIHDENGETVYTELCNNYPVGEFREIGEKIDCLLARMGVITISQNCAKLPGIEWNFVVDNKEYLYLLYFEKG